MFCLVTFSFNFEFVGRYKVLYGIHAVEAVSKELLISGMLEKFKKQGVYRFWLSEKGVFKLKRIIKEEGRYPIPKYFLNSKRKRYYKGPIFFDLTVGKRYIFGS